MRSFPECRGHAGLRLGRRHGHRSALASHLGKMAYLKKDRVTFNPAGERQYAPPPAGEAAKAARKES